MAGFADPALGGAMPSERHGDYPREVVEVLRKGGFESFDEEATFLCWAGGRMSRREYDRALNEASNGVSPYHAAGEYQVLLGEEDSVIDVPRGVMPPDSDTRAMTAATMQLSETLAPGVILDIGCGSGVLGIAALMSSPQCEGLFVDIDPRACGSTRRNLRRTRLEHRAAVVVCDLARLSTSWRGVRMVVANLPYVPSREVSSLLPRYRLHVPRIAVDGGADGMTLFRVLADVLAEKSSPGMVVALQLGPGQVRAVRSLFGDEWRTLIAPEDAQECCLSLERITYR